MPNPTYETVKDSAARTGNSRSVLFRLIADGTLTPYRVSKRKTLLKVAEVDKWIESHAEPVK